MSEQKNMLSRYKTTVPYMTLPDKSTGSLEPVLNPEGTVITLSHEDAISGLAAKTLEPFDSRGCPSCKKNGYRPCSIECYAALGGSLDKKAYILDMVELERLKSARDKAALSPKSEPPPAKVGRRLVPETKTEDV